MGLFNDNGMEPSRDSRATLVDLLDRILDKGLILNADLIISVAGIPLLGVNLKAALAGMETMLKYGVMQDWDQKTRAWESKHRNKPLPFLKDGEKTELKVYGSYYYQKGSYEAWKPGYFYLTNKRLVLYRSDFGEVVLQIAIEDIKALTLKEEEIHVRGPKKPILYLFDKEDQFYRINSTSAVQIKEAVELKIKECGLLLETTPAVPETKEEGQVTGELMENERIIHQGKRRIWYLEPATGIRQETWIPGNLFLTDKRLFWWSGFYRKIVFETSLGCITGFSSGMKNDKGSLSGKDEKVLCVTTCPDRSSTFVSSFSGSSEEINEWEKALRQLPGQEEETETCPECGKKHPVKELLEKGCPHCGWVSPALKNRKQKVAAE